MGAHWDDLKTVLALVRGGSLAAAADALGVTYTTVARRISRAEDALDTRLFERLKDGYQPTRAARLVAEQAAEMERASHAMERALLGADARLEGKLVVSAPQLLVGAVLAPVIAQFTEAHPGIDLHIRTSNRFADLGRREADLALRVSNDPGDTLKGLRLVRQDHSSFASPAWADRITADPDAPVDWIVHDQLGKLPATARELCPAARIRYRFDDMSAMAGAAAAGLGVVRMPYFLGRNWPGLTEVPAMTPARFYDIWMVGHADVWSSARVRAFRDIFVPWFRARQDLFVA